MKSRCCNSFQALQAPKPFTLEPESEPKPPPPPPKQLRTASAGLRERQSRRRLRAAAVTLCWSTSYFKAHGMISHGLPWVSMTSSKLMKAVCRLILQPGTTHTTQYPLTKDVPWLLITNSTEYSATLSP